jgi:MFS family permease
VHTFRRPFRDRAAAACGAAVFSLSLGLASVALPLLALRAGYSGVEVGLLTAASAVSQMSARMVLGRVMRVLPDWTLVAAAGVSLALGNAAVVVSTAVVPFVLAQLLQGVARACFWTGSQTHVVRGPGSSVGALAVVNFVSAVGLLGGPVLAGLVSERSPQLAMALGAGIAVLATVPAFFLDRLPPFTPSADPPPGRLWRRPGVGAACWAGVTAGAWRGLLGSYVPVALDAARQPASTIGVLVSTANGASIAGAALVGRVRGAWVARSLVLGTLATGGAVAVVALAAGHALLAGAALAISGLGAGALQTVGPAVAADSVHPEERGEAVAVTGTFRAAALFGAPLGIAGLITAIPLSAAMALTGALIALPAFIARHRTLAPVHSIQQTPNG